MIKTGETVHSDNLPRFLFREHLFLPFLIGCTAVHPTKLSSEGSFGGEFCYREKFCNFADIIYSINTNHQ